MKKRWIVTIPYLHRFVVETEEGEDPLTKAHEEGNGTIVGYQDEEAVVEPWDNVMKSSGDELQEDGMRVLHLAPRDKAKREKQIAEIIDKLCGAIKDGSKAMRDLLADDKWELAKQIVAELNKEGAGLGNMSEPIIVSVLDRMTPGA